MKKQRGAAFVEMAVLLPLLIILLFGLVELGRALLQINTLTKAVTTGARFVARAPDAVTETRDLVTGVLTGCSTGAGWAAAIAQGELLIENDNAGAGSVILPGLDVAGAITFAVPSYEVINPGNPDEVRACIINVQAEADFAAISGGSLVPFFQVGPITLRAQAEERYLGE